VSRGEVKTLEGDEESPNQHFPGLLRVASTKMKLLSTKKQKRMNYLALETASFVIIGRPLVVLSTAARHSDRIMKVLPVFKPSTIAVFSSSTS